MEVQQKKRWTCIKSICKKWEKNILKKSKVYFKEDEKYMLVYILTQGFENFTIK